jgi:hypothetical protein
MDKDKPIYITRNKQQSSSFFKSKTGKVVGLFLAGTVAVSGYIWLIEQEDKQDGQTASGAGSGYHSYSTDSSAKGASTEGISSGSAAKGGIGSSAVGGGE